MSAAAGGGVLAELAWLSEWLSDTTPQGGEAAFETVRQAHSAVAELIAADKEYDEADAQYTVAEQMYGEDSNHPEMRKARGRIIRAVKRRRAALSNIEGASHG